MKFLKTFNEYYMIKDDSDVEEENIEDYIFTSTNPNVPQEEIKKLLSGADGYGSLKDAARELEYMVNSKFNHLSNIVRLYRILFIEGEMDNIQQEFFGNHWTDEEPDNEFINNIKYSLDETPRDGTEYVIMADFKKEDIDIITTLYQRMLNPMEYEIFITDGHKPIHYKVYSLADFEKLPTMYKRNGDIEKEPT